MMMAHDSHAGRPELSPDSIAQLTAALEAYIVDHKADGLHSALRRIALEARENGIHAEQLLVSLKDAWYALGPLQSADAGEQTRMLQRVVSLCIREYYGG